MEPGSNNIVSEKTNQVKKARNIIFLLGITILVVFFAGVLLLFLNSQKNKKSATSTNITNTNINKNPANQSPQSAKLNPHPTLTIEQNEKMTIISNYVKSVIQSKYDAPDYSKLDIIYDKSSEAFQWGLKPGQTRIYSGMEFDPSNQTSNRLFIRVFPVEKVNTINGLVSSSIIGKYFSQKEGAPWDCKTYEQNIVTCKSVWSASDYQKGFMVSKATDGMVLVSGCSIAAQSPLLKTKNDCFQ